MIPEIPFSNKTPCLLNASLDWLACIESILCNVMYLA